MSESTEFRIEHDTMGEVKVPSTPSTALKPSARLRISPSRDADSNQPRLLPSRTSSAQQRS